MAASDSFSPLSIFAISTTLSSLLSNLIRVLDEMRAAGYTAPMTSLGSMAAEALQGMWSYPYRLLFPAVVLGGMIGWVGLIVPHIARMLTGPDNRLLLPVGALLGASVPGATRVLEFVTPPKPRYVAGFQYIPSAVVVETVFRKP